LHLYIKCICNIIAFMNPKTLIAELMAADLTQKEIERRTGVDQSTISGLHTGKRGKRISYEVMVKLQALHDEVVSHNKAAA
jgi:transcriptional regulator with XRE-family HTH domain